MNPRVPDSPASRRPGGQRHADPQLMFRQTLGSPALFAIVYSSVAGSIYFALGVIAGRALGLTPVVFLAAGLYFALTVMTYVEGASLHKERGGATVFARFAFNELASFVGGWAVLLDYVILIALTSFAATNYLGTFWGPLGHGTAEALLAVAIVAWLVFVNVRGLSVGILSWLAVVAVADIAMQLLVIVIGLAVVFNLDTLTQPIDLGHAPTWGQLVFAFTLSIVAFTGLESSSGLAGEVRISRAGLKRLVGARVMVTMVTLVGVGLVAVTAVPVSDGHTALGGADAEAPMVAVVGAFGSGPLDDALRYGVAAIATVVLVSAGNAAMLGLSRLAYSLATNRQIPSALGRLHPRYSTPYVVIGIAGVLGAALAIPRDLNFLMGIYAFGSLLTFTIAHMSVVVLRYREPGADRPYRMPGSIRFRGGELPVPAVLGALISAGAWLSVLLQHHDARWVGIAWMVFGIGLYVIYRTTQDKPVLKRVRIPARALQSEAPEAEYGSILVPIFGRPLDDDIVQTAGRLAGDDDEGEGGAVIEALWVFEVPMALPIDARVPDEELARARRALSRAKRVGEEYEGVEVATATVRARSAGQAIVEEARRRGVEAIVLAAEEPSRVRGGALLGGRGGPLDNFVGDVTKYVVQKAPCRVILTAPPAAEDRAGEREAVKGKVGAAIPADPSGPRTAVASPESDGAGDGRPAGEPLPAVEEPRPAAAELDQPDR